MEEPIDAQITVMRSELTVAATAGWAGVQLTVSYTRGGEDQLEGARKEIIWLLVNCPVSAVFVGEENCLFGSLHEKGHQPSWKGPAKGRLEILSRRQSSSIVELTFPYDYCTRLHTHQ